MIPVSCGDPGAGRPAREQLSALRSLLVLSMLLSRQDDQATILQIVASAVESLGSARTVGIFLSGRWQDARARGWLAGSAPAPPSELPAAGPDRAGEFILHEVPWSWAYSLSGLHGPSGYLVVGAQNPPAAEERYLLEVLGQEAGAALANARLHRREREQAAALLEVNLALRRSMEIHDRLTRVALGQGGQDGIAQAVYELTGRATAIEDRFGNLSAWAGPGRPDPYPRCDPDRRDRLLRRAATAAGPVRDGELLVSVAQLGGVPVAVLALRDPDGTSADPERVTVEHATTVLAMEVARLQSPDRTDARTRNDLVLDLVAGDGAHASGVMNRAQVLGYNLGRPHRVVVASQDQSAEDDGLFDAVSRAASAVRVGSMLAPRQHDVIMLAETEAPWEQFRSYVVTALHGRSCRIGVGGQCSELEEFPRSCREAELALRIQRTLGGPDQVTLFDDLGVYQVLATASDTSAMERFVTQWLGVLIDYDNEHGAQLVLTLSEYLGCGGSYDASARALSVHRSTLKYRLRRIRQVSGYDLGDPATQFSLQLATSAWSTLRALRQNPGGTSPD
jgi:sugar diacid utilization regulator